MSIMWDEIASFFDPLNPRLVTSKNGDRIYISNIASAATPYPQLYISTNGGNTFTPKVFTQDFAIYAVATNLSGNKVVVVGYSQTTPNPPIIYISLDNGVTWSGNVAPSLDSDIFLYCVIHPQQDYILVISGQGKLFKSSDNGATWINTFNTNNVTGLSCSSNLVVIKTRGPAAVYISIDNALTFTQTSYSNIYDFYVGGGVSNSDNIILIPQDFMTSNTTAISYDKGLSWSNLPFYSFFTSMSSDGKIQMCVLNDIYVSTDFGITFNTSEQQRYWRCAAVSPDGNILYAMYSADNGGSYLLKAVLYQPETLQKEGELVRTYYPTNTDRIDLLKAIPCPCDPTANPVTTNGQLVQQLRFRQSCCPYYILSSASASGFTVGAYYVLQGGLPKGKPTLYQAVSTTKIKVVFHGQYLTPPTAPITVVPVTGGSPITISPDITEVCPCPSFG